MIKALADLAGTRDNETGFHLKRVERYSHILAQAASKKDAFRRRMSALFLDTIGDVSVLHDIGKVGIPDAILQKPGPLSAEEFQVMKTHTTIGANTIRHIQLQFPEYGFLATTYDIALRHHERWDGTGYPGGLAGETIPLSARLVALVDTFDALTSKRVYKEAMDFSTAIDLMKGDRGTHFDPGLFDVFLEVTDEFRAVHGQLADSVVLPGP